MLQVQYKGTLCQGRLYKDNIVVFQFQDYLPRLNLLQQAMGNKSQFHAAIINASSFEVHYEIAFKQLAVKEKTSTTGCFCLGKGSIVGAQAGFEIKYENIQKSQLQSGHEFSYIAPDKYTILGYYPENSQIRCSIKQRQLGLWTLRSRYTIIVIRNNGNHIQAEKMIIKDLIKNINQDQHFIHTLSKTEQSFIKGHQDWLERQKRITTQQERFATQYERFDTKYEQCKPLIKFQEVKIYEIICGNAKHEKDC